MGGCDLMKIYKAVRQFKVNNYDLFKGVLAWTLKLEWTIILRWMRKGVCLPPDPARAEACVGRLVAVGLVAVQKPVQVAAAMGTKHLPQGFVHFVSRLQCKQKCCRWILFASHAVCQRITFSSGNSFATAMQLSLADFLAPIFHWQHHNFRKLKSSIRRPDYVFLCQSEFPLSK